MNRKIFFAFFIASSCNFLGLYSFGEKKPEKNTQTNHIYKTQKTLKRSELLRLLFLLGVNDTSIEKFRKKIEEKFMKKVNKKDLFDKQYNKQKILINIVSIKKPKNGSPENNLREIKTKKRSKLRRPAG